MQQTLNQTDDRSTSYAYLLRFLLLGMAFGLILIKSEVISWYRIQEMFRFQSFHMYGIFFSAILTGVLSVWILKKLKVKSIDGEPIEFDLKAPGWRRYLFGGTVFGLGWGLTGVCPGPIAALIGAGYGVMLAVLLSAVLGTWVYGSLRSRLPH